MSFCNMGHKKLQIPPKSLENASYRSEIIALERAVKKAKKGSMLPKEKKKELDV